MANGCVDVQSGMPDAVRRGAVSIDELWTAESWLIGLGVAERRATAVVERCRASGLALDSRSDLAASLGGKRFWTALRAQVGGALVARVQEAATQLQPLLEQATATSLVPARAEPEPCAGSLGLVTAAAGFDGLVRFESGPSLGLLRSDHEVAHDSRAPFSSTRHRVAHTTAQAEFWLVAEPSPARLEALGMHASTWELLGGGARREPRALSMLRPHWSLVNRRLQAAGVAPLEAAELLAARLYTGPMARKCAGEAFT
jgi:hypothetical protein